MNSTNFSPLTLAKNICDKISGEADASALWRFETLALFLMPADVADWEAVVENSDAGRFMGTLEQPTKTTLPNSPLKPIMNCFTFSSSGCTFLPNLDQPILKLPNPPFKPIMKCFTFSSSDCSFLPDLGQPILKPPNPPSKLIMKCITFSSSDCTFLPDLDPAILKHPNPPSGRKRRHR